MNHRILRSALLAVVAAMPAFASAQSLADVEEHKSALVAKAKKTARSAGFAGLDIYKSEFPTYHSHHPRLTTYSPSGATVVEGALDTEVSQVKTGARIMREDMIVQIGFPTWESGSYMDGEFDKNDLTISYYLKDGTHKYFWFHRKADGSCSLQLEYPAQGHFKYSPYLLETVELRGNGPWIKDVAVAMPGLAAKMDQACKVMEKTRADLSDPHGMTLAQMSAKANDPKVLGSIKELVEWSSKLDLLQTPVLTVAKQLNR